MNKYNSVIGRTQDYKITLINNDNLEEIQNLCNNCSDYYLLDKGIVADSDEAQKMLRAVPDGKSSNDLFILGVFNKYNSLIGVVHIIKDYPKLNVWMLGLLLIDPKERNKGLGRLIHNEIVDFVKNKNGNKIRIGVLEDNKSALKFWNSVGYKLEKETEMDRGNNRIKKILVFNYSI